ncbi:lysozyme [Sutterella sp.]|uniref:lysozyme n=1 Tax=Sutterella sp. TaxID=1981025 RepID=UPI0026DF8EAF|nr:lysozyme [Sutterella sp.]MDO5531446.1 lysozyme [Sutterella sp.]
MKAEYSSFSPEVIAQFIKDENLEGFSAEAYRCPAGVLTIGYGHTGVDVVEGMQLDEHHAWILLIADCERTAKAFAPYVKVPVSETQYIALTSLAFNVGVSYVTRRCPRLMSALNRGAYQACADEFLDITRAGGRVLPGLVRRRQLEAALMRQG